MTDNNNNKTIEELLMAEAKNSRQYPLSIRLNYYELKYVQDLAEKTGLSVNKVVRNLITIAMKGGENA